MLGVLYFVFTVYRTIDLCVDWYWWNDFESPTYLFTGTYMLGTALNLWYIFRALIICRNLQQPADPEKPINILAELNFHVIEVIVNLVQIYLGDLITSSIIDNGCMDSINFSFECYCCCGVVLQLYCFLKTICGWHGEEKQSGFLTILGLIVSLISAFFGYLCIKHVYSKGLRNC